MADNYENLDLDLESLDENIERKNKVEERIVNLSNKVKLTSEERDELKAHNETLSAEKASLTKEVEFFSSFTDMTSKYPGAVEYKDAIKEKVLAGYTVDDATVAVLAREGKLGGTTAPIVPKADLPAGGSAATQQLVDGDKGTGEMTQEELKAALMERLVQS